MPYGIFKVHLAHIKQTAAEFPDLKYLKLQQSLELKNGDLDQSIFGFWSTSGCVSGRISRKARFHRSSHDLFSQTDILDLKKIINEIRVLSKFLSSIL